MLAEFAPLEGRILAGGQSLVRMMAFRMARPAHLIDINSVAGFDRLSVDGNTLSIAPCLRHAAFHRAAAPGPTGGLLSSVVRNIAHYPIRLCGTFCGSLAHADPASEWCLTAATLGAEMVAARQRGRRLIAAADFFAGVMETGQLRMNCLWRRGCPYSHPMSASVSTNSAGAPAITPWLWR
jgi:aerobic carbon-monoxide dehydrogenase medium subunit